MNLPHWHLLLNHVPTVGFGVGLGLFLLAFVTRDQPLLRESLRIVVLVALISIPAYLTGVSAGRLVEGLEGVSAVRIRIHGDAALLAFVVMELAGGVAWLALWQARRLSQPRPSTVAAVALLAVASFGLMARAAYVGGLIRHPEVRSVADIAPTETAWLTNASLKSLVLNTTSVWPAAEAIHFVGLALSFGIVLVLNLRILGVMKSVAFADLHRLMPWGLIGVGVNLVSGMLFFIAIPEQVRHQHRLSVEDAAVPPRRRESPLLHLGRRPVDHRVRHRRANLRQGHCGVDDCPVGGRGLLWAHAAVHRRFVLIASYGV